MMKPIMVHSLILVLLIMNVMGTNLEEIELSMKFEYSRLYNNVKNNKKLNDKYNLNRYIPENKRSTPYDNNLPEGKIGFEQKYEMIKSHNYFCLLLERLIRSLTHQNTMIISIITSYLFSVRSITPEESTPDTVSLLDLVTMEKISSVDLLSYKPTNWNSRMVFPALPYPIFQSLKWYFLDLTNITRHDLTFSSDSIKLFWKCYLLIGSNTTSLFFYGITWNLIKFLRISDEKIEDILFYDLKDPLYLHTNQHHLPTSIREFRVINTNINCIDFREKTVIDHFVIRLNSDHYIQWDHIFLPYIKRIFDFNGPWKNEHYWYQGKELERIQYPERVRHLRFRNVDIQQLNLSKFSDLEVVEFENCHFFNPQKIFIPEYVSVSLETVSKNWFLTNLTNISLIFSYDHLTLPTILEYPESLKIFELIFFSDSQEYNTTNWYQNLTVEKVPHLHTFCLTFRGWITKYLHPLYELEEQITTGTLNLKHFSGLQKLNITHCDHRPGYDLHQFMEAVGDKLPSCLQEIKYTYKIQDHHYRYKSQIWRKGEWNTQYRQDRETISQIRERVCIKNNNNY